VEFSEEMTATIITALLEAHFHYYTIPFSWTTFKIFIYLLNAKEVGGKCGRNSMNALFKGI
jgi:hypothetical protein